MKQAIVIKNPKWEQFTAASDAFKKLNLKDTESAVLVVRGRCKEHKPAKIIAKAVSALLLFAALTVNAQQSIIGNIDNVTRLSQTTNNGIGNGILGWNPAQVAVFQVSVTGTNANATNALTLKLDTSLNGTDWATNQYTLTVTPAGSNVLGTSIAYLTNTVGGKWLRFGQIANPNASAITVNRVHWQLIP